MSSEWPPAPSPSCARPGWFAEVQRLGDGYAFFGLGFGRGRGFGAFAVAGRAGRPEAVTLTPAVLFLERIAVLQRDTGLVGLAFV